MLYYWVWQKWYNNSMETTKVKEKSVVLEGLNKAQKQAVTFGNGPLLIIAGAGTGKTTVLTRRIVWLIEQGLAKPEEILALTFTEKAATEMEERVDLLMPMGFHDLNISTFHAFAQKILQQHALEIGLPGDFKVITDTEAWLLVKKHLYDFDLDYYKPIGSPNRFIHALLKHFGKAKGEEITPADYLQHAENLRLNSGLVEIKSKARKKKKALSPEDEAEAARIMEVANAYHKYQKLLVDNKFLDFGDLINCTLQLFRKRPNVLSFYQKQYKYVLVDEFQDTDLSQYELVKMLARPENNVTVVGDDDQSIYKFRGASISNILKFKEDYKDAEEITLTENYRSTDEILNLAYNFIQLNNPERLEAKLKISKKLNSNSPLSGEVKVLHAPNLYKEAEETVDKIIELSQKESLGFNDFAILVRANDHAEPFIQELSRRGIPFMFVANRGLYKKPYILNLLAYLGLLDDYHETENLFRVLNMKKFKISEEDLVMLSQIAKRKAISLYEAIKHAQEISKLSADSIKKFEELTRLIKQHSAQAREMSASEMLVRIMNDLGLTLDLVEDSLANVENRGLVEKFYRKAQNYEEQHDDKTIKGFVNQIQSEMEAGDQGELSFNPEMGPEAVKVMTVHSAKGLEFECVFVVNLVDQRFPSRDRKEQIEIPPALVKEIISEGDIHLMEERRLFYVAATRAKRYLYLTWADDYGRTAVKKPSRFLVELGLEQKPIKAAPAGKVFFTKQPTLIEFESKLPVPDTFSFSQISCFLHCPLEYKYKYVYKLPLPGEAQLSFGVSIHKTLEKFLQALLQINAVGQADLFGGKPGKVQVPKKDVLLKLYEQSWVDDWYPNKTNKEEYRKKGLVLLDHFYQKFSEDPKLPKFLEKMFRLKIGQYKFVGKIDRGDLNPDGTIDIVDYKTGAIKEKLSPVDKEQLMIYQWAVEEEFGLKVKNLTYWYLNGLDNSSPFVGSKEDLEAVKAKLLTTMEKIIQITRNNSFHIEDRLVSHECRFRHFEV